jgi:predicted signal transduction protein with EAL and GGDEF domain
MSTYDPGGARLVEAIVATGHALKLRTVAEGIETDGQLVQLRSLGCDLGQGFGLSRPVDERVLLALLLSHGWGSSAHVADLSVGQVAEQAAGKGFAAERSEL